MMHQATQFMGHDSRIIGRFSASLLWLLVVLFVSSIHADGFEGLALDQDTGRLRWAAYHSSFPLTLDAVVKMEPNSGYSILFASHQKSSSWHWEVFTMPQTGLLTAYIPGFNPNHVHSSFNLNDSKFHHVTFILERTRARLFVDGTPVADVKLQRLPEKTGAPPQEDLLIGNVLGHRFNSEGTIREFKLANAVCLPTETMKGDFAHWDFAEKDQKEYASKGNIPGVVKLESQLGDTMDWKPLEPLRETSSLRQAAKNWLATAGIKPETLPELNARDVVWEHWRKQFENYGKLDYDKERRIDKKLQDTQWLQSLQEQVFDRQALIWKDDTGPAGTAMRRVEALLKYLDSNGLLDAQVTNRFSQTTATLKNALAKIGESPGAFYAICALRRELVLANRQLAEVGDLLCVSRGTQEGSIRSRTWTSDDVGGHFACQYFGYNAVPGGGLYRISNWRKGTPKVTDILGKSVVENGRYQGKSLVGGAFCTPDLSFDGKRIAFAWTNNKQHAKNVFGYETCFHLFVVNADGTGLCQLTDGRVNDFDPCWLPNGRLAFISERRGGYIRCFAEHLRVRNFTLFTMKPDGSDIVPASYFETSEWNPSVNHDGQIVYARWDYVDRENCLGGRFWIANPDGTDPRAPHGNYPYPWHSEPGHREDYVKRFPKVPYSGLGTRWGTPIVELGIRAIPGSRKLIFTAAPHHGQCYGALCILDLNVEDDAHHSQIRRLTPYEPYPETEMPNRTHYKYGTPWPLSEDLYLANCWEDLVALDRFGNEELICALRETADNPKECFRLIDPIPLQPRPTPPVLPDRTWQGERASKDAPKATISVMNVYDTDQPFPEGTKIKWLRVIQNVLKTNHIMGVPMAGFERESTPRIPLGIVPVEDDGSVYFEAPVGKELIFQVLNEKFEAIQSMRSVAFVFPGEQLRCIGCHEPRRRVPKVGPRPMALQREPSKLKIELGDKIEPIFYHRQIRPIIDKACRDCNHPWMKDGKSNYEGLKDAAFWFSGGMLGTMLGDYCGTHGGARTIPERFGAKASSLTKLMNDDDHRPRLTDEERHWLTLWQDCNSLRLGAFYRESEQLLGDVIWPDLDVDPANPQGIEGRGRPLKRHFWHENDYGPHRFLSIRAIENARNTIEEHTESGEICWSFTTEGAFSATKHPSGCVLIGLKDGAMLVGPNQQLKWRYRTQNPVTSALALKSGSILLVQSNGTLVQLDDAGKVERESTLSLTRPLATCNLSPDEKLLVTYLAESKIFEFALTGELLQEFSVSTMPLFIAGTSNGNILVSGSRSLVEYTRNGKSIWFVNTRRDLPELKRLRPSCPHRLPNGNTVFLHTDQQVNLFEMTPDLRVAWERPLPSGTFFVTIIK